MTKKNQNTETEHDLILTTGVPSITALTRAPSASVKGKD